MQDHPQPSSPDNEKKVRINAYHTLLWVHRITRLNYYWYVREDVAVIKVKNDDSISLALRLIRVELFCSTHMKKLSY